MDLGVYNSHGQNHKNDVVDALTVGNCTTFEYV
jgi:hypothetical protein